MEAIDVGFNSKDIEEKFNGAKWDSELGKFLESEGVYFEVIDGLVCIKSKPFNHDVAKKVLMEVINKYLSDKRLKCEAMNEMRIVRNSNNDYLIPDVVVLAYGEGKLASNGMYSGTPRLVAEIMSSNREDDLKKKRLLYAEMEIPEYWIIDLDGDCITQHILKGTTYGSKHEVFTEGLVEHHICGLKVDIMDLFYKISKKLELFGVSSNSMNNTKFF